MRLNLKTWHCLALLTLAVLVAYFPSLSAGYNSIDDLNMISWIDQMGPLDLHQLFFGGNYYYRPLTILSYLLDRDLWGLIPSFMHLGNILLHLACALLVFIITKRLLPLWGAKGEGPALFAALFFALHPIATESVSWISGRTDPLMAVFLLLAVWLSLLALPTGRPLVALAGGVALFLACLAKEVAVFILPALLWLIVVYPAHGGWLDRLRRRWWALLMPTVGVIGYFALRHLAIANDSGINTALKGVTGGGDYDLLDKARVAFKVYGFYVKKLFVPWPLNFAIVEISDWYVLAGIILAALLLYLIWRADIAGAFGLLAFCVLSPSLLVVYGKMAWTPLAERYLYASVALFAPLAAFIILRLRTLVSVAVKRRCNLALALLLMVFFATTLHRSWIWQDNLRLYQDTLAKSPNLAPVQNELASALMRKGRVAEAQELLAGMQTGSNAPDYINDDMNLAGNLLSSGDLDKARAILLPLLQTNSKQHYELLQHLLRINDHRIGRAETPELQLAIQQESLVWLQEQQHLRPSAFTIFRIAKMQLSMGDKTEALISFRSALEKTPADAYYRGAAETFIEKLEGL